MQGGGRELHRSSFSEKVRRIVSPKEWRWKFYSKAREGPCKVFRDEGSARRYVHRCANSRSFGMHEEEMLSAEETPEYARAKYKHGELLKLVLGWMDNEYTGAAIHAAMLEYPPVLVTVGGTPSLFPIGDTVYYGTNCISTRMFWKDEGMEGAMLASITHEVHHYACWIGKGRMIRWRDEGGRPVFWKNEKEGDSEFTEGVTEMLSMQLLWEKGVRDFRVENKDMVYLGLHLQEIAGKEETRKAYFSGDYTFVRRNVDAALGEGAFEDVLVMLKESGAWEALTFLREIAQRVEFGVPGFYGRDLVKEVWGRFDVRMFPFAEAGGGSA